MPAPTNAAELATYLQTVKVSARATAVVVKEQQVATLGGFEAFVTAANPASVQYFIFPTPSTSVESIVKSRTT